MPDYLGNIEVPEIAPSGVFPIVPDYGYGVAMQPAIAVHRFGSANAKIEQRFLLGTGAKRFMARKSQMREADRVALRNFWEARYGPYGAFTYNAPNDDGNGTTPYICRFANEPLSWEFLSDACSSTGVTLIEIPTTSPEYELIDSATRFPTAGLEAALLDQVQELIPLIKLQPLAPAYPAIYLSDRRCTVGEQLYLARLLEWDGISQSIGNETDQAQFTFGNADRAMRNLANDTDLLRASVEFSLFHVGTGTKLDLWKGDVVDWQLDAGPEFKMSAADGMYELNLPYPTRKISRSCWKDFNDGAGCPFTAESSGMDVVHFPDGDALACDKGYDTRNGCLAHGMGKYFGGILAEPQGVNVKDNSTGLWGFGRSMLTSVSLVAESIYDEVIPEIYTDSSMPVNCKIAAGREEGDFYNALGIVGEGPLVFGTGHKLDGQYHHGYPGPLGLRTVVGNDPAEPTYDFFSLGQGGGAGGDWRMYESGGWSWKKNFAAGTAFLELRRSDPKGLQLSRPTDHAMTAIIARGIVGWVWTASGVRSLQTLTNPIWIVVNMALRAHGLKFADAATAELHFDVDAAIAAAAICDDVVDKMVGAGTETQFKFRGIIQEEKPLRDWIQEILMNCLGFYTFSFGKLWIGVRENSSAVESFTVGNILFNSLQLTPKKPAFNHLTANFADEEFEFVTNSVTVYDIGHAKRIGGATSPVFLKGNLNLSGSSSKSQTARIVTTRLREELGGITPDDWKAARQLAFGTTVLALSTMPGMVCSMTHADMPGGAGEFRISGWRLGKDYSIQIQGETTTDSMYDLVAGPKPADVVASPVPVEFGALPFGMVWHPDKAHPVAGDPMFAEDDGSFGLQRRYKALADDSMELELAIVGKQPVNSFIADALWPAIRTIGSAAVGGSLAGGLDYYVAVCCRDSDNRFTQPSNIVAIRVPAGTATNLITLSEIEWPVGTFDGYDVFAAVGDARMMCHQASGAGSPASIDVAGPLSRSTWSMPNRNFRNLRMKVKRIAHVGVAKFEVTSVAANTIVAAGAIGADDWTGRDLSVVNSPGFPEVPLLDFAVTVFNGPTGAFTVTPDPVAAGLLPGDIIVVRAMPAAECPAGSVTDSKFENGTMPAGLVTNAEKGKLVRVVSGNGRGQVRRIFGNTSTQISIDFPWETLPDATSRFIVEDAAWQFFAESSPSSNADPELETEAAAVVTNEFDCDFLVQAVAVDSLGVESPDFLSPIREVYVSSDVGNPTGASGFVILQNGDDASIKPGFMVCQVNRPTQNYRSIFALEVYLSPSLPGQGPCAVERAAHPASIIEPPAACVVTAGNKEIQITRSANPAVLGRPLLIYRSDASPDSDLDGNVIEAEGVNRLRVGKAFSKGGAFSGVVTKCWWRADDSVNTWEHTFYMDELEIQSVEEPVWRTKPVEVPASGVFYATMLIRNTFGVEAIS